MMYRLLYYIILLLTPTVSIAQEDTVQLKKLRALDFLAGKWQVETNTRLSVNGPWEKSTGTAIIKVTLDSSLFEEEYTGSREGKPFLSKTLFAVTNSDYKYQRIFIDGPHGVLIEFTGDFKKDLLVFDRHHVYKNGNSVELRVVYTILSASEFKLESMRMPQGSNTWDITSNMYYKKLN